MRRRRKCKKQKEKEKEKEKKKKKKKKEEEEEEVEEEEVEEEEEEEEKKKKNILRKSYWRHKTPKERVRSCRNASGLRLGGVQCSAETQTIFTKDCQQFSSVTPREYRDRAMKLVTTDFCSIFSVHRTRSSSHVI
jgi:outer membrane biosynthesis protein TonB